MVLPRLRCFPGLAETPFPALDAVLERAVVVAGTIEMATLFRSIGQSQKSGQFGHLTHKMSIS
jgi:hypothetical protein